MARPARTACRWSATPATRSSGGAGADTLDGEIPDRGTRRSAGGNGAGAYIGDAPDTRRHKSNDVSDTDAVKPHFDRHTHDGRREPDADRHGDQRHRQHAGERHHRQRQRQHAGRRRRRGHPVGRRRQRHLYRRQCRRQVSEAGGSGTDTVQSSVSFTLGADIENLTLTGTAAISGTGNELDNIITGNAGANTLDGGAGADSLSGGAGNDTYIVDNAGDDGHRSGAAAASTRCKSRVNFTLGADVENLTLTGTAINGTGNALDNIITGNASATRWTAAPAPTALTGGDGNDTYIVDNVGDQVTEAAGEGTDTVKSSVNFTLGANVENLTLTGTARSTAPATGSTTSSPAMPAPTRWTAAPARTA